MSDRNRYYVSTPIYYVNDRPHIGHVYTTTVADVMARYMRLKGKEVFFLTGTDEHATKVVEKAEENGVSPQEWADLNAGHFQAAFAELGLSNDDFIRTSEDRHKERVTRYVSQLMDSGDVYPGEYEGWYDPSQEEYVPDNKAREYEFKSPITGRDLVKKSEKNYFFRLSAYAEPLLAHIERNPEFIVPEARRNELVGRIKEGLNDVPMSRTGAGDWGIPVPGDAEHTIYVWIDALFNYLTTVDTDDRRDNWPCDLHLLAKDILWFHAAIWPAMLMALGKIPGNEWIGLPAQICSHSFWISEGRKMSKSLGNFIDLELIHRYVDTFGLDALRYFLAGYGPMGTSDRDFAEARFIEAYNKELANVVGNGASRVGSMIGKYCEGKLPAPSVEIDGTAELQSAVAKSVARYTEAMRSVRLDVACEAAVDVFRAVDLYIDRTRPFKMAKDLEQREAVGTVLYHCAEGIRIGSMLLAPVMPERMAALWAAYGLNDPTEVGVDAFTEWMEWGRGTPGMNIEKVALFARYQPPENDS